jgi:hypothetical protein
MGRKTSRANEDAPRFAGVVPGASFYTLVYRTSFQPLSNPLLGYTSHCHIELNRTDVLRAINFRGSNSRSGSSISNTRAALEYAGPQDMPWPDFVITQFDLVNRFTTDESEYYGPFNTLLTSLFPPSESYQVAPHFKRIRGSMDFAVVYIVMKRKIPVFFLEVKTYLAFDHDSLRKEADDQMRDKFLDFVSGSLSLPKLYGISALGTRYAVYEYHPHDRTLTPTRILPHPDIVNDTAPQERWKYDVMAPEGEAKLWQLVGEIKDMTTALSEDCKPYTFLLLVF